MRRLEKINSFSSYKGELKTPRYFSLARAMQLFNTCIHFLIISSSNPCLWLRIGQNRNSHLVVGDDIFSHNSVYSSAYTQFSHLKSFSKGENRYFCSVVGDFCIHLSCIFIHRHFSSQNPINPVFYYTQTAFY